MKNATTPVVRILLPAMLAAAGPVHALPSIASNIYAAESRHSVIDPTLGRRMGQDFPEHYAGKAYTSQCDTYNRTSLGLATTDNLQTGCMGDFNGDGCTDVAAVVYVTGDPGNLRQMVTCYGSPTGFSPAYRAAFSTVGSTGAPLLKSMDMDGDGDLDLVYMVGFSNATHELAVFYNLASGSGFFDTAVSVISPVGAGGGNPRLMDVVPLHYNLDRYADLAVADAANDRVVVYLGSSTNTFTLSPTTITEDHPNRLWAADLDRDGRDDLVTACGEYFTAGTRRLTWRRNTGLGWGSTNILDVLVTTDTLHTGFAMTDVNDDGWQDMVYCRTQKTVSGNLTSHDNSLWYRPAVKGNPGGYTGHLEMPGFTNGWGGSIYGLCGGDIDGDGDEDVLGAAGGRVFTHENIRVHGDSAAVVTDLSGTLPSGAVKFAVADVNRDSWQDLVATSPNGRAILWYPGRAAGGFGTPVSISTGTAVPDHPCAGDFDADGETDLVWAIPATGEIKRAFNNNGQGTSWSQGTIATQSGLVWLTAGNLNNDADTELLTLNSSGAVAWLLNSNSGTTWSADALPPLSGATQAVIGKFTSNTLKEVAVVGNAPGTLEVRDSNIFANPKWELVHGESFANGPSVGVTSGDFNRDGWIDCAWTNGTGTISWRTPGLTVSQTAAVGTVTGTVRRLRAIDWNRDGWEDILVAHTSGVTVFLSRSPNGKYNTTTGYWTPQVLFSGGSCSDAIAIDIDHDGRTDVAAYDTTAGKLKLITHDPDAQASVTDEPMTTSARRANGGDSFYVLELNARNAGRRDGRSSTGTGGFTDDVNVSLNRIRLRFVEAVKSGYEWIPGNALTQTEIAASVDKVLIVRESTTLSDPTLDLNDTILAEATVSTSGGYMTVNFADSTSDWDDLAPLSSGATYHIALKMKPTVSAATTGRFFVQHAPTDAAQGTRCTNPQYWPVDTPVGTESADRTDGQLVSPTTSIEAWRYAWFGTYTSTGNAWDNADGDRDGMPNLVEYLLFTNPTVADGRPLLSLVPSGANFAVRVDLPAQQRDDALVILEESGSLGGWTTLAQRTGTGAWTGAPFTTSSPGGGITRSTFTVANQTRRFYRLNITLAP